MVTKVLNHGDTEGTKGLNSRSCGVGGAARRSASSVVTEDWNPGGADVAKRNKISMNQEDEKDLGDLCDLCG